MTTAANAGYSGADHAFRENDPYARAKYDLTLRWLEPRAHPGDTLYTVGVGSGYFNHLAVSRGLQVVGCEPDPVAFDAAQASAPPGCELYACGLEAFARDRAAARFVVMHDVLEHIEDDEAAVSQLRGLVADGGTVVLSVPALMSLFGRHDEELGHFRRYTARSLRRVLEPRFHIAHLQWYGMASIPIAWYFSRWRRMPYPLGAARSPLGAAYGAVCALEARVPEPIGTS
ncbi:MAG: methyltransferase domain-containing protein, partial [Vulcanimicrobiaceae bacterium]